MQVDGIREEKITLKVDPMQVIRRISNELLQKIVTKANLPKDSCTGCSYDGEYFIDQKGFWIGVICSYGRGSDIQHVLREATQEEIDSYKSINNFLKLSEDLYK